MAEGETSSTDRVDVHVTRDHLYIINSCVFSLTVGQPECQCNVFRYDDLCLSTLIICGFRRNDICFIVFEKLGISIDFMENQ